MDRYVVLGDVVGSRDVEDREALRESLEDACEQVTAVHEEAVVAPFAPLKGVDELAGVLSSPAPVYDVVDGFRETLHPQELRLVVARGAIDVGLDAGDPAVMDGPAFHRADELLADIGDGAFRFAMDFGDERLDRAVADEVNLLLFRKREWTDHQRRVVRLYRELGDQTAVAGELGVSQPAVSRTLERAAWPALREIEGRLRTTFARYE
jgi:hypothetical protein